MIDWRPIPSLPGVFASSDGRIMVKPHFQSMPRGGSRKYGGLPTRGQWDGSRYIYPRHGKTYKVARLVCEAFHGPAPEDKPYCLHRDEDSRNNRSKNLYWGTQQENLNAPGFIAYCKSRTRENSPAYKARRKRAL